MISQTSAGNNVLWLGAATDAERKGNTHRVLRDRMAHSLEGWNQWLKGVGPEWKDMVAGRIRASKLTAVDCYPSKRDWNGI